MTVAVDLIQALKRILRAQSLTYRDLALRLHLSEAAVKRMFSLRAMSLQRLEEICDVLDVGLAELSAEAARGRVSLASLSEEQEQALVDDPQLLLAMFLTLNRWRQEDVQAHFTFTTPQWTALLVRLDRLGIIELMPGNRGRPLTTRNFRWLSDGPMERYFRHHLLGDFFADPFDGEQDALFLLSGSLSSAGIKHLRQRLGELAKEFDSLLARDATLPAQERMGVSLILAQKPWLLQLFHPYRRSQEGR
ncbi:helix-turn-helix domain-containing protein [Luteimonas panaciterrae]|jgi:DNA-binding Xre family transcriptional regulator|uniref:helix-turn-helix domain-containing protein n=1 Tax=Luteimonas panaciterrae TaxID=363885 RepID=UPI001CFB7D3B|nr:helix-turn-helix transcriptional regulator [Luteimonas panaciterrae]